MSKKPQQFLSTGKKLTVEELNKVNDLEPCPKPHVLLWNAIKGGMFCGLKCLTPGNQDKNKPLFNDDQIKIAEPFYPGSVFDVTHPIPQRELEQWSGTVMLRYITQMFCCGVNVCNPSFNTIPFGFLRYAFPSVKLIKDEDMGKLFSTTILSTFIHKLTKADVDALAKFGYRDLNCEYPERAENKFYQCPIVKPSATKPRSGKAYYYKVDYEMVKNVQPNGPMSLECCGMNMFQYDGATHTCGTVALFRRYGTNDADPFELVGIKVIQVQKSTGQDVISYFKPGDKDNWELAKLYLLANGMMATLFIDHPAQAHFPMSTVNSFTKCTFPQSHPLYQLLDPHFYLHMGVNDVVRFNDTSVAIMEKVTPFNCFTFSGYDESTKFFKMGYAGIEGSTVYTPYKFDSKPRDIESIYGRFLNSFYPKVREFVDKILAANAPDEYTIKWADKIAPFLPGFPTGKDLKDKGREYTLDVIAKIIWLSSIEHSATHYSFAGLPKENAAMRIRVPPPCYMDTDMKLNPKKINNVIDRSQQFLAWQMFFTDEPVLYLKDVKYGFEDPKHKKAGQEFLRDVEKLCAEWGEHCVIDFDKIASSVQY